MSRRDRVFSSFSAQAAKATGSPAAFVISVLATVGWAATGPWAGYSETWQLIINTATTILTYLMVFVIQNTQNRDSAAVHAKLDELLRAVSGARNDHRGIESGTRAEIEQMTEEGQS